MKRLVTLLPLLTLFFLSSQGQAYPVTVTGTVVDSNGTPVANEWVYVVADSTLCGGMLWNYTDSAQTNASGVYTITINVPACAQTGYLSCYIYECGVFTYSNWQFGQFGNNPGQNNLSFSFISCPATGGGGGGNGWVIDGMVFDTLINGQLVATEFAEVFLIQYDSVAGTLTAIDTVVTDSIGHYAFFNLTQGNYMVKAALLPASPRYATRVPTYYTNSLYWSSATYAPNTPVFSTADITLITGNNPGGPGFIGGLVSQGANKTAGPGDPMPGIEVLLLDNANNPVAWVWTDANGSFSFPNLAYGTYKIWPEVAGKNTVPVVVTIGPSNPSNNTIRVDVNSTEIIAGLSPVKDEVAGMKVSFFPNPSFGNATLQVELDQAGAAELSLLDVNGRTLGSQSLELRSGKNAIAQDLSPLSPGVYFIRVQTEKGVLTTRVVRQ